MTADVLAQWRAAGMSRLSVKLGGADGSVYEESTHRLHVNAARQIGMPADRYWFNGRSASIAAQVTRIGQILASVPLAGDEEFMWDVESQGSMAHWTPAEVVTAATALAPTVPLDRQTVYMSAAVTTLDWSPVVKLGLRLIVAAYGANDGGLHDGGVLVGSWPNCDRLQYTSVGRLPGYGGNLDLNRGGVKLWTVHALQAALNTVQGAGLTIDGVRGRDTTAEVIVFQKAHGLKPDGVPGQATLSMLLTVVGRIPEFGQHDVKGAS